MSKRKPRKRRAKVRPKLGDPAAPKTSRKRQPKPSPGVSLGVPAGLLLYGCVIISGAAALTYEIVWARKLAQFIGITAHAHTAVLTAFMAGLALGSYVIGRRADRIARPLRAYALLELGIGLYALGTLLLFDGAEAVYVAAARAFGVSGTAAHALRFALALLLLLVPTFLMGGTLPLLVRGLSRGTRQVAKTTSRLYGLNTLGATLGALAGGYLLLPGLGMTGTTLVSAGLALAAAVGVLSLGGRIEPGPLEQSETEPGNAETTEADVPETGGAIARHGDPPASPTLWILVGFALSGFAAMVYQLSWIRALTLVIGGSVYAFSTTLTTFLAGIALGSFAANRFAGTYSRDRYLGIAGWLQAGVAISALVSLGLIGLLPDLFLRGYQAGLTERFPLYLGLIFLLCFLVMFVPTFLLGALFPMVATTWARETKQVGNGIGTAYAANSAGTILGALAGGLLVLPQLGIHGSTFLAAGATVLAGALFWLPCVDRTGRRRLLSIGGVIAAATLVALLVPSWDRTVMTSGVFYHTKWFTDHEDWRETVHNRKLLYYEEGVDAIVCVTEADGHRILHINGKPDGSNGGDLSTQVLLAQIPMLLHPDPRKAAVIGLGTGTTPAGAAAHETLESLDVIEISPEVIEASRLFSDINHGVLDDPRTVLHVADARNYLLATEKRFDVIVSEPSNPWISGIANMFTRESFELARSRLAKGGIMSQWIHSYNMAPEDLRGIIGTYRSVFPEVTLWMPTRGDLILIGSETPHALDYDRVRSSLRTGGAVHPILSSIGKETFEKIAATYVMGSGESKEYAGAAPLNTDDRPRLEFSAPRYLYAMTTGENLAGIVKFLEGRTIAPPVNGLARSEEGALSIPSIGLTIRPAQSSIEDVRFAFTVVRRLERNGAFFEGTQHLLEWREGKDLISLAASANQQPWTSEDRDGILSSAMVRGIVEKGEVSLPAGARANWVAGAGAGGPGSVGTMGLAWTTKSGESQYRDFFCIRQFNTHPVAADAAAAMARRFASQFSRFLDTGGASDP